MFVLSFEINLKMMTYDVSKSYSAMLNTFEMALMKITVSVDCNNKNVIRVLLQSLCVFVRLCHFLNIGNYISLKSDTHGKKLNTPFF